METPQSSRHQSRRSSIGIDEAPFQSPVMSFPTILADMERLGYTEIQQDDLEQARKEKIRNLYLFLLEICAGMNEEKMQLRASRFQSLCEGLPFAEQLHENNFNDLVFYLELRDVIVAAGYKNFSLRDIHSPDAKRLRHILSSLMNYCKFREQQIPVYAKLHADRNGLIETYETLQLEKESLLEQRADAMLEAEERSNQIDEITKLCEEMEQTFLEMNRQQANDRKMTAEARKDSTAISDKVETAKWDKENHLEEIRKLETTELVKSPERKKKLCQDRQEALETIKKEHAELVEDIEGVSSLTHRALQYKAPLAELLILATQVIQLQEQISISKKKEPKVQDDLRAVEAKLAEANNAVNEEEHTLARLQYQLEHNGEIPYDEDDLRRKRKQALDKEEMTRQRLLAVKAQYEKQMEDQRAELEEVETFHQDLQREYIEKMG